MSVTKKLANREFQVSKTPNSACKAAKAGRVPMVPHSFQKTALELFSATNKGLYSAGCGSGKTAVVLLAAYLDHQRSNRGQLIVVPSNGIAAGFATHQKFKVARKLIEVDIPASCNFLNGSGRSRVQRLKEWLLGEKGNVNFVAVCSYPALVLAFESMNSKEQRYLRDNVALRFDEAHHLDGSPVFNQAGSVLRYYMEQDSSVVGLTTATAFRADGPIMDRDLMQQFKSYHLPHLVAMEHNGIEAYQFHFAELDPKNPGTMVRNSVKALLRDGFKANYLIVVPARARGWRKKVGYQRFLRDFMKEYSNFRVLNTVDMTTRAQEETYIQAVETEFRDYDVVVTCKKVLEGVNWRACSAVIDTNTPTQSAVLAEQIAGRMSRYFDGKARVRYVNALYTSDAELYNINFYINQLLVARIMELEDVEPLVALVKGEDGTRERTDIRTMVDGILGPHGFANLMNQVILVYETNRDGDWESVVIETIVAQFPDLCSDEQETIVKAALNHIARQIQVKINTPQAFTYKLGCDLDKITRERYSRVIRDLGSPSLLFTGSFCAKDLKELQQLVRESDSEVAYACIAYCRQHKSLPVCGVRGGDRSPEYRGLSKLRKGQNPHLHPQMDAIFKSLGLEWRRKDEDQPPRSVLDLWAQVRATKERPYQKSRSDPARVWKTFIKMRAGTHYKSWKQETMQLFQELGVLWDLPKVPPGLQRACDWVAKHKRAVRHANREDHPELWAMYKLLQKVRYGTHYSEHLAYVKSVYKKAGVKW